MAHPEQIAFCRSIKERYPTLFEGSSVLDIGSLDINGNNRYLFSGGTYIGVDVGKGKNVDVVSLGHEYRPDQVFDLVISTECLEHDPHWALTLMNMARLCRSEGLVLMTCATTGRQEHGTSRSLPADSPLSHTMFKDHYLNLTEEMVREIPDFLTQFSEYGFSSNLRTRDLYFYGLKK